MPIQPPPAPPARPAPPAVQRPRLGVTEWLAKPVDDGFVVGQIVPDSPAAEAGLQQGDVILSLNGIAIHGAPDLPGALGGVSRGDRVTMVILRDGARLPVTIQF